MQPMPIGPLTTLVAALGVAAIAWWFARKVRSSAQEACRGDNGLPPGYYHAKAACNSPCPIHAPTKHHLVGWPRRFRCDRDIFERRCEHGRWHPDPDSVERIAVTRSGGEAMDVSVHLCPCQCCVPVGDRSVPVP